MSSNMKNGNDCAPVHSRDAIDDMKEKLPPVESWPQSPVFFMCHGDTEAKGYNVYESLPLGVPIEFESPIFKGKILCRLRNAPSAEPFSHNMYFEGRKRLTQCVVQGKFKEEIKMSDVYCSNEYQRKLALVPPPTLMKIMRIMFQKMLPGVVVDLCSDKPKIQVLYAGTTQSLSINREGEEPDITKTTVAEETTLLGEIFRKNSAKRRKKILSKPKYAENYAFNTKHVYTFHNYDDAVDYGRYTLKLPVLGDFDLARTLNGQPCSFAARCKDGRTIFSFPVWHERLLDERAPETESSGESA